MNQKALVCGAGGYVGSRLVDFLLRAGFSVRAVSSRPVSRWLRSNPHAENLSLNLKDPTQANKAVSGMNHVYNLAASVGGIGFVQANNAACLSNVSINNNLLFSSALEGVERFFFASSSCVYPDGIQTPLKEIDAYPASPMGGYGWEKLFSERTCLAYASERDLPVSIARYHGIYGPGDIRPEGKDHVATALARKIVRAKKTGASEIEIWGDGSQTRSLLYIDDCVEGTFRLMSNRVEGPVNLANPIPVSVMDILSALQLIAGTNLNVRMDLTAPTGRQNKTSDNAVLRQSLGWEPTTGLFAGLSMLYSSVWETENV